MGMELEEVGEGTLILEAKFISNLTQGFGRRL